MGGAREKRLLHFGIDTSRVADGMRIFRDVGKVTNLSQALTLGMDAGND